MEKLDIAYKAVSLLESVGMSLSREQTLAIVRMEKEYLQEEVMPMVIKEIAPLMEKFQNMFQMEVTYKKETGVVIRLIEKKYVEPSLFGEQHVGKSKKKKYDIRVTFPNGRVSHQKYVWKTLMDVIRYAGVENVRKLNIPIMGSTLVSDKLLDDPRYHIAQKEVEPGLYVCTISSTDTKYEQILTINKKLGLGLNVEKVSL